MKKQKTGIYFIINKINNKIYIGSANNFLERKNRHIRELEKGRHHSILLQRAWDKYGRKNFEFHFIESCSKKYLFVIEQKYLDFYKPFSPKGYNISHKAQGCCCIGERNGMYGKRGELNPNFGRRLSKEVKEILSLKNKGKKRSEEFKQKMREIAKDRPSPMKGKHLSETAKKEISKKKSQKVYLFDKISGDFFIEFPSAKTAGLFFGRADGSTISRSCKTGSVFNKKYICRKQSQGFTKDNFYLQQQFD